MSTDTAISQLFSALGQSIGIPGLAPDQQGCCRLVFDGARLVELRLASGRQQLVMCAALASSLVGTQARLLLQANFWATGSAGGWFALNEQDQPVFHMAIGLAQAQPTQLMGMLEVLLSTVETWERRLQQTLAVDQPWQHMANFSQRI